MIGAPRIPRTDDRNDEIGEIHSALDGWRPLFTMLADWQGFRKVSIHDMLGRKLWQGAHCQGAMPNPLLTTAPYRQPFCTWQTRLRAGQVESARACSLSRMESTHAGT